ncbi:FAD-dependent oxidoreductase [Sulfitobacter pseudonitzschiae]|uniref:FAD-dependent oxidoreductase n=1 Tax=Pseudosulfitobacter pseudonitzschiae TaxID=1402135 RepID=A0A9Q2NSC6_9RHOB|nr:FAD-dependent oxidoreductase [Pseudosulfitobacter pseudonitzschiae]MBM2294226.1 FAD-dependent oxidoreductase [Pseudosulfitobacter pseudonitzschiae]MBM2299150.1 FAD-dependent oxidoreductase [Pseudosulfitobacter pseudonitzschiae]MBM2304058.1 FAD-dependent oxidoreductase [Pseudosulfitobacter pseudonitzschiae]MBM2313839.1 FAD-dependent oxidoreductase [Pseudosulfitobacter pseudonitzschiae]MBM2318754.1 FAD-dependent oxidoreductase [Pseudosulfitobacter pseudonitzschiae]
MTSIKTDILIIGAGSGGLSVAAGAVQMGADVTLLEGHKMGGDCLNYGCVPSKALIAAAKAAHGQRHSAQYGVADAPGTVDYAAVMEHVADVIAQIAPVDSVERFEGLGVRVIREWGRFTGPHKVQAGDVEITARRIVIATGSSPLVPPIDGLDSVPFMTNETLFDLRDRPDHLLIVGGGPIGMEMAQAHVRLGCKVTVIEGDTALGKDDPELAQVVLQSLKDEGVEIAENAKASRISGSAGDITIETEDGRSFHGTHLLMAVGRKTNTERLNLEAAGIATTKRGVKVDDSLRTSNRRVYAIGDVAGGMQFTHVAGYHAGVIIRSMLFSLPSKAKTAHIPWATYTDPELAQVGLTEAQARAQHGDRLEVVRFDYHHNDRAIAERKTRGFIKVMVVKGRPVGASIVGYQAGELINLWALALANNMKMGQIAAMVSPYPTIGEVNKRAAGAYFSPRLFDSTLVKTVVGLVQRFIP